MSMRALLVGNWKQIAKNIVYILFNFILRFVNMIKFRIQVLLSIASLLTNIFLYINLMYFVSNKKKTILRMSVSGSFPAKCWWTKVHAGWRTRHCLRHESDLELWGHASLLPLLLRLLQQGQINGCWIQVQICMSIKASVHEGT